MNAFIDKESVKLGPQGATPLVTEEKPAWRQEQQRTFGKALGVAEQLATMKGKYTTSRVTILPGVVCKTVCVGVSRSASLCSCRTDGHCGFKKALQTVQQDVYMQYPCIPISRPRCHDAGTFQAFKSLLRSRSACLVGVVPPHSNNTAAWSVTG